MQQVIKQLDWRPGPPDWQQVGGRSGPHWHEGGVRWVAHSIVKWNGKDIQVGHVTTRKPTL